MTNQISVIDQLGFADSKATRSEMAAAIINNVSEGVTDPLQVHYHLKCLEDLIKQVTASDRFRDALITEAVKYGKFFDFKNSRMDVKEVGTKYDFTVCNDPEWNELNGQMEAIKFKMKHREATLKTLPISGMDIVSPETGEVTKIYPPTKSSTTSISVTLK